MSENPAPEDRGRDTENHTANPKRTQVDAVTTSGRPRTTDESTQETADIETETAEETPEDSTADT